MAQDALHQSFVSLPPRAAGGALRLLGCAASTKARLLARASLRFAAMRAQQFPLVIGIPALAVPAISAMGYLSLGPAIGFLPQAIAAGALALAFINGRRAATRMEATAQFYSL